MILGFRQSILLGIILEISTLSEAFVSSKYDIGSSNYKIFHSVSLRVSTVASSKDIMSNYDGDSDAMSSSFSAEKLQKQPSQQPPTPPTPPEYEQDAKLKDNKPKKRTLYEILGASPTDTRSEIKQKYVMLAKQSHPDALVGSSSPSAAAVGDFSEIAAAWRILSDAKQRKRYDRSLQAERISDDIVNWAGDMLTKAVPAAETSIQILEQLAVPFFRFQNVVSTTRSKMNAPTKTTTSTRKITTTTAKNNSRSVATTATTTKPVTVSSSSSGMTKVPPFRQQRLVDRQKMELQEKSMLLEQQAISEYKKAMSLQQDLQDVVQKRLRLALRTAYSGITSAEAMLVLEELTKLVMTDEETQQSQSSAPPQQVSTRFWRPTASSNYNNNHNNNNNNVAHSKMTGQIGDEIRFLHQLEESFVETQQLDSAAQEFYRDQVRLRMQAKSALTKALQEEEDARIRYMEAQKRVIQQKKYLESVTSDLTYSEHQAQKSSYEVERKSISVERQSEQVRIALSRYRHQIKAKLLGHYHGNRNRELEQSNYHLSSDYENDDISTNQLNSFVMEDYDDYDDSSYGKTSISDKQNEVLLDELARLRQEERDIAEQSTRLEVKAARLLSRSNKLKQEALGSSSNSK